MDTESVKVGLDRVLRSKWVYFSFTNVICKKVNKIVKNVLHLIRVYARIFFVKGVYLLDSLYHNPFINIYTPLKTLWFPHRVLTMYFL